MLRKMKIRSYESEKLINASTFPLTVEMSEKSMITSSNSSISSDGNVMEKANGSTSPRSKDAKDLPLEEVVFVVNPIPPTTIIDEVSNVLSPSTQLSFDTSSVSRKRRVSDGDKLNPSSFNTLSVNSITSSSYISDISQDEQGPYIYTEEPSTKKMKEGIANTMSSSSQILASPYDEMYLNPLHCFVRKRIECFIATLTDIAAPSPGRKNAIKYGQVGLRCIFCRDVPIRGRTKRATSYPTRLNRIYHCVSDMKFDHFSNCKHMPNEDKEIFSTLKSICANKSQRGESKGNTAEYYLETATRMGLVDADDGTVRMQTQSFASHPTVTATRRHPLKNPELISHCFQTTDSYGMINKSPMHFTSPSQQQMQIYQESSVVSLSQDHVVQNYHNGNAVNNDKSKNIQSQSDISPNRTSFKHQIIMREKHVPSILQDTKSRNTTSVRPAPSTTDPSKIKRKLVDSPLEAHQSNSMLLSSPQDALELNPIHCFVRKHIEVFVATENDIKAPAPGRKKTISVGQVGIRCVHCSKLPFKDRIKRAVCYPPSIGSIYHSVSNMKFDHFGICRALPPSAKAEFLILKQKSCSYGRKVGSVDGDNKISGSTSSHGIGKKNNSSTATYYIESAKKDLGVFDTPHGIRVENDVFIKKTNLISTSTSTTRSIEKDNHNEQNNSLNEIVNSKLMTSLNSVMSDGMSVLVLAATNPDIRKEYESRKLLSKSC